MANTKQFTYDAKVKSFFTQASDIQYSGRDTLQLVSERTGKSSEWVVQRLQRDREQELQAWHLVPTAATLREHPGLAGHTMIIYND